MTKKTLSDEDKALFRSCMQGVKPLHSTNKISIKQSPPPISYKKTIIPLETTTFLPPWSNTPNTTVESDTILDHHPPSFPKKRLQQFKQGLIPWEAKLDLHGLSVLDAEQTLRHFLEHHIQQHHRSLLIIHGKGKDPLAPILKNLVNHWLKQCPQILAFHSARGADGGTGAVYVLLKRQKKYF